MDFNNLQNWTTDEAYEAQSKGFAVVYHNGKITLEWEDGEGR